jgi:two-component system, OmpR family, KDP operon response regulator KdpE
MSTPGRVLHPESAPSTVPMKAPRVLLVGANRPLRRALRVTLASVGYAIIEAPTGEQALDQLQAAGRAAVDIVVLDFEISGIGGRETCQRIRNLGDVPILALSVFRDPEDKIEASQAGADGYLVKPFGIQDLLSSLRNLRSRVGGMEFMPAV